MSTIALSSGMALVAVIDMLRTAERPMSAKLLSKVTKVSQGEVAREIERLKQAQQLKVYTVPLIGGREFYELVEISNDKPI